MKKQKAIKLAAILACCLAFSSCIPVFDAISNSLEQALIMVEKIMHEQTLKKWENYSDEFKKMQKVFDIYYKYAKAGDFAKIKPDDIEKFLRAPYMYNKDGEETWGDLWSGRESILDRYKELKDFSHIYNNPIYKRNPHWKKVMDGDISEEKAWLQDVQNNLNMIADFREWENSIFQKEKARLKKISQVAIDEKGALARQAIIRIELKLENLYQRLQLVTMLRMQLENRLKKEIRTRNSIRERELLEMENSNGNH